MILTNFNLYIDQTLGTIQELRYQRGGWYQNMAIFNDSHYCKSSNFLKRWKTWWRSTRMVPYWNGFLFMNALWIVSYLIIIKSLHIQGLHLFAFSILLKMVTLDTFHIAIVFIVAINYSVLVSHRQCHFILGWALWNQNSLEFKFDDTRLSS